MKKVVKTDWCWEWQACVDKDGYGRFSIGGGKWTRAHRVAYEMFNNEKISPGMEVDHLCRNRKCVNPEHLEVVTDWTNMNRGFSPAARNLRKTECSNGHPFTPDNIYWEGDHRKCRECRKNRQANMYDSMRTATRKPKPTREALKSMLEAGMTRVAIAIEHGVSDTAVRKWIRSYGL